MLRGKQVVPVCWDSDILEFFKVADAGYQTRIKAALPSYMNGRW